MLLNFGAQTNIKNYSGKISLEMKDFKSEIVQQIYQESENMRFLLFKYYQLQFNLKEKDINKELKDRIVQFEVKKLIN